MLMRAQDWARCAAAHDGGSVTVHWTDPVDRSQSYIPMASTFVSKLVATAARARAERPFHVIYSHYLEPYGIAGFLAAQMTRVPHVRAQAFAPVRPIRLTTGGKPRTESPARWLWVIRIGDCIRASVD